MKIEIEISHNVFTAAYELAADFNNEPLKQSLERVLEAWAKSDRMGTDEFQDLLMLANQPFVETPEIEDELDEPREL